MLWLGERRGSLFDWVTQCWVRVTGRRVDLSRDAWLAGPVGGTERIGADYFAALARREGLEVFPGRDAGLLPDVGELAGPSFDAATIDPAVARFYERTSRYDLDAWGEWSGVFLPFGRLLALIFSRRLQQLNVPLSALDTSRGVTSDVVRLVAPDGRVRHTAWVRTLRGNAAVLYVGAYSTCRVPRRPSPCVKVVFPLPNGNATVFMRAAAGENGALVLTSSGDAFGDAGFYFTVHDRGRVWARYLRTFRERIVVYPDGDTVRADHEFTIWRLRFLRLHYRCVERGGGTPSPR